MLVPINLVCSLLVDGFAPLPALARHINNNHQQLVKVYKDKEQALISKHKILAQTFPDIQF